MSTQNIIEGFIDDSDFVGGIYEMNFQACKIHTNEYIQKNVCGGLAKHTLLIAKMEQSVIGGESEADEESDEMSNADTLHEHALLLRISEPTDLPIQDELTSARHRNIEERVVAEMKGEGQRRNLDGLTRQELQKTAYEAEILGTFYYDENGDFKFGGDAHTVFSSGEYTVYKPRGDSLSKIVSYLAAQDIDESSLINIGNVQYASTDLRADSTTSASVQIDTTDLIGAKTAVFGMTGTGKSNTLKILATAVHSTQDDVGQLIFDPSGEYTPNDQDEIALSTIDDDIEPLSYEALATDLLDADNAREAQSQARSQIISRRTQGIPGYGETFAHIELPESEPRPNDYDDHGDMRHDRKLLAAFQAVLIEAGLEPDDNWSRQFPTGQDTRDTVENHTDIDIPSDPNGPQNGRITRNGDHVGWHNDNGQVNIEDPEALVEFWTAIAENPSDAGFSEDDDSIEILEMITTQYRGTNLLNELHNFHEPSRDRTPDDHIYDLLTDGKLVIVDLTEGQESVVSSQLRKITNGLLGKSVAKFNNLNEGEDMPRIQIFLEEAHRYFSTDKFDNEDDSPYVQLAKEGRKFNLGLVYATQEVSAVDDRVLANTANWIVTHLNSRSETGNLSDYYDFETFEESILKIDNKQGFSRVRTDSNSFTVPTQIREFAPNWIKQVVGLPDDYVRLGALNPSAQTGVGGGISLDTHTYGNLDTRIHFEAEVPEPTYWRTDAYSSYTGSGWEREAGTQPYEEPLSFDGESDEQIEYEVTLKQESVALPIPWRPETVSGVDDLSLTSQDGIRSAGSTPSGTTYNGVSNVPKDDAEMLREAGTEYPEKIAELYTQLPEDTPSRLLERAGEIVGDAPTPYDVAVTLMEWLKNEKQYSLEAAATSDNIADEFVFEMDEGYCEHFATALVVMLRSQNIPARYTVGYSSGDEITDGVYEIRGMHAHAWTEVYFPGFGWVKLDPTPGEDRQATHEEALADSSDEEDEAEEDATEEPLTDDDEIDW